MFNRNIFQKCTVDNLVPSLLSGVFLIQRNADGCDAADDDAAAYDAYATHDDAADGQTTHDAQSIS